MRIKFNMHKNGIPAVALLLGLVPAGYAQLLKTGGYRLEGGIDSRIQSGGIVDVLISGQSVWVGTGRGLSGTTDSGTTWSNFSVSNGMGRGSVCAVAIRNSVVWAATCFDTLTPEGSLTAGGGLGYSTNQGLTWHWMQQPVDVQANPNGGAVAGGMRNVVYTLAQQLMQRAKDAVFEAEGVRVATNIQNITYDIALTDSAVWIASFGGGLRKSSDLGKTWRVVTVDGLAFNPLAHLTHRVFSVHHDGEALWAGTAGGVHKSTDGGKTWATFSHQNQKQGISGNFVVAIARQKTGTRNIVWAATIETTVESKDSTEFKAVSKSEDGGLTWSTVLKGEFAHNFAFDDSVVFVATDRGLFKSPDCGGTWAAFSRIADAENGEVVYSNAVNCAASGRDHGLWVGTNDGLALTRNDGLAWRVFRAFQTPGAGNEPKTYAYPNPFSPQRSNLLGDEGHVRFQYRTERPTRVTLRIYDFGMNPVKTVVQQRERPVAGEYTEVWNGKNDVGDDVAIGVYFYKVELEGATPFWGKVLVVN